MCKKEGEESHQLTKNNDIDMRLSKHQMLQRSTDYRRSFSEMSTSSCLGCLWQSKSFEQL